jgi:cell shape-determining protein MreC
MDNEAEKLMIKLMLRDKEIITALQVELQQLKELLNKSKSSKK